MWTVSTGKGHRCLRLHRGISTHTSNLYRAVMRCAHTTEVMPYYMYYVRMPTPVAHGCWTPPCYRRLVAARVFTHARVPYFSLMCQRPLWSRCQRLTHLADVLVRTTASVDLTTPTCRKVMTCRTISRLPHLWC